ncbi:hypothetical protein EWB00_000348 [Schistosoma japonicum]|uniref:Uncharacterized protein n=1 Tax=Schistosoma japonicum TaxID=6182 RepID=A0A4Z2CL19_SCHJA|nr:hypothetical protein EWB00_000348 [Schistosoma japonicum]
MGYGRVTWEENNNTSNAPEAGLDTKAVRGRGSNALSGKSRQEEDGEEKVMACGARWPCQSLFPWDLLNN